ncbi:MAG: Xaa-Pro peptidase family protein, partial [Pseudomonadota bacterium]
MADASLVFPIDEFRSRTTRLQAAMAQGSMDALLLTSAADIFYVTGFLTRFWESPARPWFLIVPATGTPIAVIPGIGAPLMSRTWIEDIRTWDAPDPRDDGVTLLADTLGDIVPTSGRVGVPMGIEAHLRMPLKDYTSLVETLRPRMFMDATSVVQRTRETKSEREIAKIKDTCAIAGRAFDTLGKADLEGRSLADLFRTFQSALLSEGADWVSYVAGAAGATGYVDVISPATKTPLSPGDVVMLDTGAVKDGYFCDFDRNIAYGVPGKNVQRVNEVLWDVTEEALTELRPGMRACDAHALLWNGLTQSPGTGRNASTC